MSRDESNRPDGRQRLGARRDPGARRTLAEMSSHGTKNHALERIDRALMRSFGIQCLPQRNWLLEGRATKRCAELGLSGLEEYATFLESRPEESAELFEMVRIGQTAWMRHARSLDRLIEEHLIKRPIQTNIWSAGCGTGQEAYSLAMLLLEAGLSRFRVIGTDLSRKAVQQAAGGFYDAQQAQGLEESLKRKYWIRHGRGIEAGMKLRRLCSFSRHNLLCDPLPKAQDVILCRNVLMYFAPHAAQMVLDRLISALKPGGLLLLGPSELGREAAERLVPIRSAGGVIWQKPEPALVPEPGDPWNAHGRHETDQGATLSLVMPREERERKETSIVLKGSYTDERIGDLEATLSARLRTAPTILLLDLDGADFLCDQAAEVISRAAHHVELFQGVVRLKATKPGVERWVRRCGLAHLLEDPDGGGRP